MTGTELKHLRETAGVLLKDLAMRLGMDMGRLSRFEGGYGGRMPEDLPARYVEAVREIVRERAEAVEAIAPTEPAASAA